MKERTGEINMGKYCEKCRKVFSDDNAKFCKECGSELMDITFDREDNDNNFQKDQCEYKRPDKVRFSERWILVKIAFFEIFILRFVDLLFLKGLGSLDLLGTVVASVLIALFVYFLDRANRNYAGNPHMLKLPLRDKTLVRITELCCVMAGAMLVLFVWRWGGAVKDGIGIWGVFSLKTWIALPAMKCYRIAHWATVILLCSCWLLSNRTYDWVVKNISEGDSWIAKFDKWTEK